MSNSYNNATLQQYQLQEVIRQFMDFRGRTPLKLGMEWGGGDIRALSANNVQMGRIDFSKESYYGSDALYKRWMTRGDCEKSDVLLTTEAPLGNVAQIPDDKKYILSQRTLLLKSDKTKADSNYLFHLFQSPQFQASLIRNSTGTTVVGIQRTKLEKIDIELPSLPEQRKIARILTRLDNLIEKTEALIAKYQAMKQGMMHDLFNRGVDHGHLRPPYAEAPELYRESYLGWIPKEWSEDRFGNLTSKIIDGTHFTPTYIEHGIPFLRVTDIQSDNIAFEELKFIPEREHRILCQRCDPQRGDILLSKNGTIGIPKIVDWDWPFSIFVSLALIRPIKAAVNTRFLYHILRSDVVWDQIRRRSKQGTVTNLHLEEIRELLIPLPKMDEQNSISTSLDKIEVNARVEQHNLTNLNVIKSGLMQDLLTGKVRVKVDEEAKNV